MIKKLRSLVLTLSGIILIATFFTPALSSCINQGEPGQKAGPAVTVQEIKPKETGDSIFDEVDEMPRFYGGQDSLLRFIAENTTYPEDAKNKNIQGRVIVRFVVRKDCSVSDVTLAKGIDSLLDAEALKVISSLPKFEKPAKKGDEAVAVSMMVPITFTLK